MFNCASDSQVASVAHRSGSLISGRRVSAAKNNAGRRAIRSPLAVRQLQSLFHILTPRKTAFLLRFCRCTREAEGSSEEIPAAGGENAAVIFRSEVCEA